MIIDQIIWIKNKSKKDVKCYPQTGTNITSKKSHQKREKKKNHHRLKVVGVLGEKSDHSHQNTKPQLKPSGGNYLLVGGGFSQTFVGIFTPNHWGRWFHPFWTRLHIFFRMGYGLVEKTTEAVYWIHPPIHRDRPKTRRSLHVSFVKVDRWDLTLSGTQGPRGEMAEMARRLPGFCIWMVHDTWMVFWRFVGLNVTNLYKSWFCLKLASLKMGHVSVVEFKVLGFKVEATDRLEVRFFDVLRESPWLADRQKVGPTRSTMNFQGRRRPSIEP